MAANGDVPGSLPRAVLLLLLMAFMACHAEERGIYLVLMEGDPVAFHRGSGPLEEGKRVDPNR